MRLPIRVPGPVRTRVSAISLFMERPHLPACPLDDNTGPLYGLAIALSNPPAAARPRRSGLDQRAERPSAASGAVERALDILLAFKPQDDALTVSELLVRVDLSRPTLYRLLRTLQGKQFLISSGDPQRFRLGPASGLARPRLDGGPSISARRPSRRCGNLWNETGETVALFVPEGTYRCASRRCPASRH